MELNNYSVIITGKILDNFQLEQVIPATAKLFKCSEDKARSMFQGKAFALKKNLEKSIAEKYIQQLQKLGIASHIDPKEEPLGLALEPIGEAAASTPGLSLVDNDDAPATASTASLALDPAPQQATAAPNEPKADTPEDEEENEFDELMTFVAENTDAYRLKFSELHDNDGRFKVQWHWPAFFITVPWLIYRKMYIPIPVYFGISILLSLLLPPLVQMIIGLAIPGLLGNYLYFVHARKKIGKIAATDMDRQHAIANAGGVNSIPVTIAGSIAAGFLIWMVMALFVAPTLMSDEFGAAMEEVQKNQQTINQLDDPKEKATMAGMMMLKGALSLHLMGANASGQDIDLPRTIDELAQMMDMPENALQDAWGHDLDLQNDNGVLTLHSAGIDGKFDTEDDISFTISK